MTDDPTSDIADILGPVPSLDDVFTNPEKLGAATDPDNVSQQARQGVRRIMPGTTAKVRPGPFEKELVQTFGMIGAAVRFVNTTDGDVIIANSDRMGAAWADLASKNPKVKAALAKLMAPGPWAGVITATLPVTIAILANHGMLPMQYATIAAETTDRLDADGGMGT